VSGARTRAALVALAGLWTVLQATVLPGTVPSGKVQQSAPERSPAAATAPAELWLERVDARGLPLGELCRLLSEATGVNLVPSALAAPLPVSIFLRDLTLDQAISALCSAFQLWSRTEAEGRIVRLGTAEEYDRDLRSFQSEQIEYFTLLYPNVFDVGEAVRSLFGSRVILRDRDADRELFEDLGDRLARFDLFDSRTQGFGESSLGGGGALGGGNQFGNNLGTNLNGGEDSGRSLDNGPIDGERSVTAQSDPLSAAEIRLLEEAAGVHDPRLEQWLGSRIEAPIYVTAARRQNKLIVRTADAQALADIRTLVQRLDVPTALVLLEVRILAVDLVDGHSSFFEYQWRDGDFGGQFSTGQIAPAEDGALGVGGTGVRPTDFVFQVVDSTFAARLQLLERDNRVETVATPVLLTANNEVSRLFVGREVPLNRSFTAGQVVATDSSTATVSGSTSIEFRPVGTTLFVTPSINADRTVTLQVVQEASDADSTAPILVPSDGGFQSFNVPVVSSQSVSGTIVAKSELAVAFGGLIETTLRQEIEAVPFLGRIPLLGVLFRREVLGSRAAS
jgi:general secretion pathway protein D